jgi:hypothetical protein
MFRGYPLDNYTPTVDIKNQDWKNSLMYSHIKNMLMSGNQHETDNFIDWIAHMLQDPLNSYGVGHLFCGMQGLGKSLVGKWLKNLIGSSHYIEYTNTEDFFSNFNANQSGKLLNVFEEVETKGAAFKNYNRLKGEMTAKFKKCEPKGIDSYPVRNCARFLFFTNNRHCLYVENDDRRYTMHLIPIQELPSENYYQALADEVDDLNKCNIAFEYLTNLKYDKANQKKAIDTAYKTEQKDANLPIGIKFIKTLIEDGFDGVVFEKVNGEPSQYVSVAEMGRVYKLYCDLQGHKYCMSSLKTQIAKISVEESRPYVDNMESKKQIRSYKLDVNLIQNNFRLFMKDPTFTFDNKTGGLF